MNHSDLNILHKSDQRSIFCKICKSYSMQPFIISETPLCLSLFPLFLSHTRRQRSPIPALYPAGFLHGQPEPRAFPGCRVEARAPPSLSGLLLQRVICHRCFHLANEKNRQLGKIRSHWGIQMHPVPRSPYLYQYYLHSGGSVHQTDVDRGLHSSFIVINLGCYGFDRRTKELWFPARYSLRHLRF